MRYDVKKFLFVGLNNEKEPFFQKAQEIGLVHFIKTGTAQAKETSQEIQDIANAIKILRGLPPVEQEDIEEYSLAEGLVHKILDLKQTIEKLFEEERIARLEISRVDVFGDFPLEDLTYLEKETGRKVQFYFAKEGLAQQSELPEDVIYVATEHGLDYFMALNKEATQYPKMVEIVISKPVGAWRKELIRILEDRHKAEKRLKTYSKYNTFLHHALIFKLNHQNLKNASDDVKQEFDGNLFFVEGWVPANRVAELQPLVTDMNIYVEEVAFEPEDVPPTYLENKGTGQIGEDLVHIYDTPSHTDKDPSLWVLVFFSLFFAFIVGDAGYGMVFLAAALYIRYRYSLKQSGQRAIKLFMILGAATVIWGVLTTSFFGITFDIDSPFRKLSLVSWMAEKKADYIIKTQNKEWNYWIKKYPQLANEKNAHQFLKKGVVHKEGSKSYEILNSFSDNIMFELAILIGIIHLALSLLRYSDRNYGNFGWIMFLLGAYLYLPYFLHADSLIYFIFGVDPARGAQNGIYLMIGGVGFATAYAIYKHKFTGILEPMNVIQLFADSMSYLRLYALGLSGAMLTATMNDLAASANFVMATLIVVLGNFVNMVLCIMGGTIHGLRLNFLEWYHYSFEGGGKPFNPLRKLSID